MEGNRDRIFEDIISNIEQYALTRKIVAGSLFVATLNRNCGLASTLGKRACTDKKIEKAAFSWDGESALVISKLVFSDHSHETVTGLSAINSLIELNEERLLNVNASEILFEIGNKKNVAVIGHYPFVDELRMAAENVWVIERRQRDGDYPEEAATDILPLSDVVAIFGTTLINHTLQSVLTLCPQRTIKMLLGPSTCLSEVLFDYGIDIVSGCLVVNAQRVMDLMKKGANFREIKREETVRLITLVKNRTYWGGFDYERIQ